MGGRKLYDRSGTEFTSPVALYRASTGNDADIDAVEEVLDLSGSHVAMNLVNIYVQGTVGDQIRLYVDPNGDGVWYVANDFTLAYPEEGHSFNAIPAGRLKIMNVAVAGSVTIYEEHSA